MNRSSRHLLSLLTPLAMLAVVALTARPVPAQVPYPRSRSFSSYGRPGGIGPASRPAFSPYLNLLRDGNSTLLNYYGLVRPEIEFRSSNEQFQQNFQRVESELTRERRRLNGSGLPDSGHSVQFLSDLRGGGDWGLDRRNSGTADPDRPGASRLAPTGHPAFFGNRGPWFTGRPGVQAPRR